MSTQIQSAAEALSGGACFFAEYIPRHCAVNGLDPAPFLDPDHEPEPAVCPHCGRPLRYPRLMDDDPAMGWRPIPEPCGNPRCKEIEAQIERRRAHTERVRLLEEQVRLIGIPRGYQRCTTKNFEPANASLSAALDAVRRYAEDFESMYASGAGLYIMGPVGTGKTHLAAAIARAALWADHTVLFTSSGDLLERIKDGFADDDSTFLMRCRNVGLLIIDDIGKEYATEWALSKFSDIIGVRYAAGRPTVYTSNFQVDDGSGRGMCLRDALSRRGGRDSAEAIVSRIKGSCNVVAVIGEDWRRKA